MKSNIPIIIFFLLFSGLSCAGNGIDFRNLPNDEIGKEFYLSSKIDGKSGISVNELEKKFGSSDSISKKSQWTGGRLHIYKLSNNRKMKIDTVKGQVMLAVIENSDGSNFLLWK